MVVGMPNVGKSTIINRLRSLGLQTSVKAVRVGDLPGITRSVSGLVRILDEPLTFIWDSPGILMPKIERPEQGMKLAITGAIMDKVVGDHLLADFLLRYLQSQPSREYLDYFKLKEEPKDTMPFLEHIARTRNAVNPNGTVNVHNAVSYMMRSFRSGSLGRFTLDEIPTT